MDDKVLSQLAQLRKIFVGNVRRFRAEFMVALIDELAEAYAGLQFDPDNMTPIKHAFLNLDAPARLWDGSDCPEVLVEALHVAIGKRIASSEEDQDRMSDLRDEIHDLDITDDSVPEPDEPEPEDDEPLHPPDETDDDGNDGHSVSLPPMDDDDDDLPVPATPDVLYHGTPEFNEDRISVEGLTAGSSRKPVTLKPTIPDALATGARHVNGDQSQVSIFAVDVKSLIADGVFDVNHANYGHGDVWEVSEVPPGYLEIRISGTA